MSETQPTVQYREIPGYPGYRVGDDGSVWSCLERHYPKGKFGQGVQWRPGSKWMRMKPVTNKNGGHHHVLVRGRHIFIHRLILLAFVGPCPEGMECCHNDGDPTNNRLDNLRWDSPKNNKRDSILHGTHAVGERSGKSKLTDERVKQARIDAANGMPLSQIAKRCGVNWHTIQRVVRGNAWKHIT